MLREKPHSFNLFHPGSIPKKTIFYLLARGNSGSKVLLTLNNQRLASFNIPTNYIEPGFPKGVNFPADALFEENNQLRLELESGRKNKIHV